MTDARVLLERHRPRLAYDSLEVYFADSAAIWTDSPTNVLRRADGTVLATPGSADSRGASRPWPAPLADRPGPEGVTLRVPGRSTMDGAHDHEASTIDRRIQARPPRLSLGFLGPHVYADGRPVLADDVIGETTRDYAAHAAALHRRPEYANRVHGHARRDRDGRLWLQYWLFYYYNDFQILGSIGGGRHEGDWELVQIRLGPSEQPEQAVFSQHRTAESRAWADVRKPAGAPNTPLVYVARGSHANYFRPGTHWTGTWFDNADGRGAQITPTVEVLGDTQPAWIHWPGSWGDTKATSSPLDAASPRSPGRRPAWTDPTALVPKWIARGRP